MDPATTTSRFRGTMEGVRLLDVVQLCCRTAATCALQVTNGKRRGCLWLAGGDIVHAESDELRGEDAALAILTWRGGSFVVNNRATTAETSIMTTGEQLVMRAACALDERPPTPEDAPGPAAGEAAAVTTSGTPTAETAMDAPVEEAAQAQAAAAAEEAEAARQGRIASRGEAFYGLSGDIGAALGLGPPLSVQAKGSTNRISVDVDADGSARVSAGPLRPEDSLTNAPKIEGSFVVDDFGEMLACDLPASLANALREVGSKVLALRQATSMDGDACNSFELQFQEHRLYGRRIAVGFLCILAQPAADAAAARAALAVISRQLSALR